MSNSDCIAAASAVIAFCALFLTIWQGCLVRKHNQLTVRPSISCRSSNKEINVFKLSLTNDGLGVAIIKSLVITGNEVALNFGSETIKFILDEGKVSILDVWVVDIDGEVSVAAGATLELFEIKCSNNSEFSNLRNAFNMYELKVCYSCLYGNKFTSQLMIC